MAPSTAARHCELARTAGSAARSSSTVTLPLTLSEVTPCCSRCAAVAGGSENARAALARSISAPSRGDSPCDLHSFPPPPFFCQRVRANAARGASLQHIGASSISAPAAYRRHRTATRPATVSKLSSKFTRLSSEEI